MLSQRQLDINGHGKGDTATYTRSDFTEGLEPKDIREASEPQGISHGFNPYPMPMGVRAGERPVSMTSGGTRFIPWKVRTGTEVPTMCNGHAREPSGEISGSEDVFGHCDDQGVLRRSSQITNDQISANERPGNGHHFRNKKATNYDGISSWQDFLVHFEMVCEINGWDDITKALELATSFRGSAQAVLSDLRPDLRRSYVHLVAALTSRFQPSNQAELYRAQMKNKSRGKTQSLPELAQDIKRLTRLAYPTAPMEVREQLSRDCFMDSLNDPDLEWSIFQGKPMTIDDSVRIGLEYEAFTTGHRRKFPKQTALRRQTESFEGLDEDENMSGIIDRLARIEKQSARPKPSLTCYFCGIKGYIKRDCRKFQTLQGQQQGRSNGVTRYTQTTKESSVSPDREIIRG